MPRRPAHESSRTASARTPIGFFGHHGRFDPSCPSDPRASDRADGRGAVGSSAVAGSLAGGRTNLRNNEIVSSPTPVPSPQPRRALRHRVLLAGSGIGIVAAVAVGIVAAAGSTGDSPRTPVPPLAYTAEPTVPRGLNLVDELDQLDEELLYAPIDAVTSEWIDSLQVAVMADPSFGAVAISPDRTTVTITWYGEPSRTLTEQLAAAPEGLAVVIQEAAFQPGELQALVGQAMQPDLLPGVRVSMGAVENDGSGIRIGVWELPDGSTEADLARQLAAAIGRPDVPVTVEIAQIVPAM